jgi:hypothetical protein
VYPASTYPQVNKAYEKFEKQLKAAKGSGAKQKADKVSDLPTGVSGTHPLSFIGCREAAGQDSYLEAFWLLHQCHSFEHCRFSSILRQVCLSLVACDCRSVTMLPRRSTRRPGAWMMQVQPPQGRTSRRSGPTTR